MIIKLIQDDGKLDKITEQNHKTFLQLFVDNIVIFLKYNIGFYL